MSEFVKVQLLEYKTGMRRINAKYIQRFGSPGNYNYVYQTKKYSKLPRKTKAVFNRIVHKSGRFLKSVQLKYGATRLQVKTLGWHRALIKLSGDRGSIEIPADLTQHATKGYRTKVQHRINRLTVARTDLKKKGILRYR